MLPVFVVIVLLSALLSFYAVLRIGIGLRLRRPVLISLVTAATLMGALHQTILFVGNYTPMEHAFAVIFVCAIMSSFASLTLPWVLLSDVLLILTSLWRLKRQSPGFRAKARKIFCAILCVIYIPLSIYATYEATADPKVKVIDLYYQELPKALEGFKILQVTDVHASPLFLRERTEAIVKTVNEHPSQLVLFTGDQTDGTPQARGNDVEPFDDLKAQLGIFFISGNHEYITDFGEWIEYYRAKGWDLILNDSRTVEHNGALITVLGLADDSAPSRGYEGPDLQKALDGAKNGGFTILLAHQPRHADIYSDPRYGIDLMLSGHTHGGQLFYLKNLMAKANNGFVHGLYDLGSMLLYVSPGTGLWCGYATRLGTASEITQFVLHRADG